MIRDLAGDSKKILLDNSRFFAVGTDYRRDGPERLFSILTGASTRLASGDGF
jgi:hypothetical protein